MSPQYSSLFGCVFACKNYCAVPLAQKLRTDSLWPKIESLHCRTDFSQDFTPYQSSHIDSNLYPALDMPSELSEVQKDLVNSRVFVQSGAVSQSFPGEAGKR